MHISVLGTGLMGRPMAERLLAAGHEVTVYNRTAEKAAPLAAEGAVIAASSLEALAASPVTIVMVPDVAATRALLTPDGRWPELAGKTILQCSTIASADSRALHAEVAAAGGEYVEAPVLGSTPQVREGKLIVLVGSTVAQFERWQPLLTALGPAPVRVGEVGQAATLKLALNQLIASHATAFSLSLALVQGQGVDVDLFLQILRQSALYAPTFDAKLPRYLAHDYSNPNFPTALMVKDLDLIRRESQAAGLATDAVDGIRALFAAAVAAGFGADDYSAVYEAVHPPRDHS